MTDRRPAGFTLLELIVAIAVVAIVAGAATVAFHGLDRPAIETWEQVRRDARRRAVEEARSVVVIPDSAPASAVLFLPDGRAVGPGVDPLSGRTAKP